MSYQVETATHSAQFLNSSFIRKIESGQIKEAMDTGSLFVRERLRQAAAVREVIEPQGAGEEDIDRDEHTDQPKIIIDKEPDSSATFVQFQGTGRRTWFKGPRYAVRFGKVESQRFTKSKPELMTYRSDIRKILSDNSVMDMADEEDRKFYELVSVIIAANPAVQRTIGPFGSTTVKAAMQAMLTGTRKRPIGKMLLSKERFLEALDLPATSVGDDIAKRHFDTGIESTERLWGIPVVTHVKSDIYPTERAWIFSPTAPNNFLGHFFTLQDATLFIEQKADIISFWTYEFIGIGIANSLSMQEIVFA